MENRRTEIKFTISWNKNTLTTFAAAGAASLIAGITAETILKNVKPSHLKNTSRAILGVSAITAVASYAYVRKHQTFRLARDGFSQDLHVV